MGLYLIFSLMLNLFGEQAHGALRTDSPSVRARTEMGILPFWEGESLASLPQMEPWLVLRCYFSDVIAEPADTLTLEKLFNGSEGVGDYFRDISYGAANFYFQVIPRWFPLHYTKDQDKPLQRRERVQRCIDASGIDISPYRGVIAIRNSGVDCGFGGNDVLLDPGCLSVTYASHEMGHRLGLNHSFDLTRRKLSAWSKPGEYYDPWDIMSAMNVYRKETANGTLGGPDMTAAFKIQLGWMPWEKIVDVSVQAMPGEMEMALAPYDRPEFQAPLVIRISDFPGIGLGERDLYYTVEYRKARAWDYGIVYDGVLIHRVENGRPHVVRDTLWNAGEVYEAPEGFQILIGDMNGNGTKRIGVSIPTP